MQAFHLLSRGGVNFDKQKFKSDVKLFSVGLHSLQPTTTKTQQGSSHDDAKGKKELKDGELPPELDFFKYAAAGALKRKPPGPGEGRAKRKKHEKEEIIDGSDPNSEDKEDGSSDTGVGRMPNFSMPRDRVTTKGNNAPQRVATFEELRDRYRIHSQLMGNLKRYGYEYPTGIQSAGCPILLEVSNSIKLRHIELMVAASRYGCYIPYGYRENLILSVTRYDLTPRSDIKLYDKRREGHPCYCFGPYTRAGTPNL